MVFIKLPHFSRCCMMDVYTGLLLVFTTAKFPFYIPWKHQKTFGFLFLSGGIKCKQEGEFLLINSLFRGRVAHQTKCKIWAILISDKKELKTVALPVQQQPNAAHCGVFALTFIHYTLSEKTPVEANFDTSKMRSHLLHCLVENEPLQLPRKS